MGVKTFHQGRNLTIFRFIQSAHFRHFQSKSKMEKRYKSPFNVCTLAGEIPNEIGNLKILEFLAIDTNYLSGPIPPGFQYFNRKNHESTRQSDFGPHASKHREFFNMRKSACRNNSQLHY